ncbi:hypothetical protein [Clostridium butyricum]
MGSPWDVPWTVPKMAQPLKILGYNPGTIPWTDIWLSNVGRGKGKDRLGKDRLGKIIEEKIHTQHQFPFLLQHMKLYLINLD